MNNLRNHILILPFFIFLLICSLAGCEYNYYVEPPVVVIIDSNKVVSFKTEIIPIFNADCNMNGCHSASSKVANLDLSPENAYQQLIDKVMIDTLVPESSALYKRMNSSPFMPPSGKLPADKLGLILTWIAKGAPDN